MRKGETGVAVDLEGAVRGCGVRYVKVLEAYDVEGNLDTIREAWAYAKENREPAVLVFRHPCVTMLKAKPEKRPVSVVADKCIGCRICQDRFGCPGLAWDGENRKAFIDPLLRRLRGLRVGLPPRGHREHRGGALACSSS
jgi:indolepyruvate ferredoxin oxidoreductase alpha subunit